MEDVLPFSTNPNIIMIDTNLPIPTPGNIPTNPTTGIDPVDLTPYEADVSEFDRLMSDTSASTFESRFNNLTPEQQQRVIDAFANFKEANDQARAALENLGRPPELDTGRITELGYVDAYLKEAEDYQNKVASALSHTSGAVEAGLKLVDTMMSIDPELVKTMPDLGKHLIQLMQFAGMTPEGIQKVATAFGIQAP
jgi:hypothetical protein